MLRLNRSDYESNITITPATDNSAEGGYKQYLNQAEARFTGLFLERHLLTAGVDFREEGRNNVSTDDMDVDNFSVYLQDEYQILDPLLLVLGVRFDDHSEFGSQWTPKASLVYAVNANFRVKGGYGRGFRAPSITELSVTSWKKKGKLIYEPNPDLDPEKSESYEAGIEGNYGSFRGSATAFRNEVKNMIDAVYERTVGTGNSAKDYYQYQNVADARMQGIELKAG
jgi:outer membrane receptor for ferrienterochelin and colicins